MEIVLVQDVDTLGSVGSVVKVKSGFARNYLIPRGLAVPATPAQLRVVQEITRQRGKRNARLKAQAQEIKATLESKAITLSLEVGEEDKAFGAITAHDILQALEQKGIVLDRHALKLEHPIKTLGSFDVPVHVHPEVPVVLKVIVIKA